MDCDCVRIVEMILGVPVVFWWKPKVHKGEECGRKGQRVFEKHGKGEQVNERNPELAWHIPTCS